MISLIDIYYSLSPTNPQYLAAIRFEADRL